MRTLAVVVAACVLVPCPVLAQSTGSISGIVTDEVTHAPLASVTVQVCPTASVDACEEGGTYSKAVTDVSGSYSIQNLAAGSYYVKAKPSLSYVSEVYPDVACVAKDCTMKQGTVVTVAAGATTSINFALVQGGTITGAVTRADNGTSVSTSVLVYSTHGSLVRSATSTLITGTYALGGLPAGDYYLMTHGAPGGLVDILYPNVSCGALGWWCALEQGTTVAVTTGSTTTVNMSLPVGGTITGRITAPQGGNLTSVLVNETVHPDADGYYAVTVDPGTYYVDAHMYGTSPYVRTYYGGACTGCASSGQKTAVVVGSGATVSGIDIALAAAVTPTGSIGGGISTTITAPFSTSGASSRVAAYDAGGHFVASSTYSYPSGSDVWPTDYRISGLSAGTYYVRFENPACSGMYQDQFCGGLSPDITYGYGPCATVDCDVRRGTPVVVGTDPVSGIDFTVAAGAAIGIDGVSVTQFPRPQLYDARGVAVDADRLIFTGCHAGLCGRPWFRGLPAGTYYLRTPDGRLYGGTRCPDCPATAAQPIVLTTAQSLRVSMTAPWPASATITGTVRDAVTNSPLGAVGVSVSDVDGQSVSTTTDATGAYGFGSGYGTTDLDEGTYYVSAGGSVRHAGRRYNNLPCSGCDAVTGSPLTVTAAGATNVDFALPAGGVVQVQVTDMNGVGLNAQAVDFYDTSARRAGVADMTKSWDFQASVHLEPGTYFAVSRPLSGYVMTHYAWTYDGPHGGWVWGTPCRRGACDVTMGQPVIVSLSTPVTITMPIASCTPGDISPTILASAVQDHAFRQVLTPSTPNTYLYVTSGRLPSGLALDAPTGVLSGTPTESGVFNFTVASVDDNGCAFTRQYTLQVAKCAFTLSPESMTVGVDGTSVNVAVSDVCGDPDVVSQADWITADATSASGSTPLNVTVAASSLAGSRVGTIAIGRRVFTVRQAGHGATGPFGSYDSPSDNTQVSGSIAVSGWALDDLEVTGVRILREPVGAEPAGSLIFVGNAVLVDGARPDVEREYASYPFASRAGWGYLLLTSMLPNQGNGTFRLHAIADDAEGHASELGTKTIVCVNSTATVPFGAIDTPAQGATVSGAAYRNWGWALTTSSKNMASDGSGVQVLIDGTSIGPLHQYNLFRSDVSGLFPGLANSPGPVGYRDLDTTALAEGVHTIAWVATDSAGAATGIGSRYFTVRNSVDAQPAGLFRAPQTGQRAASLTLPTRDTLAYRISPLQVLRVSFGRTGKCRAAYAAYLVANGELRDLPAGASIDADGLFTWQPGPAFHGVYEFAIVTTDCAGAIERRSLLVRVLE